VPNPIPKTDEKLKAHAQQALDALKAARVTIVTAESCTAGSIAAMLAQAEGASDILHGGFITYTKEHKTKALGVPWRLLKEHGAVNADVVKQLASGALERSSASMAIAVSGVLGPEPDEDGNPVGLVYFCVLTNDKHPRVVKEEFGEQPHDELLERTLHRAFDLIEVSVSAMRGSMPTRSCIASSTIPTAREGLVAEDRPPK
jgi:PncC family amidohydrolase